MKCHNEINITFTLYINVTKFLLTRIAVWMEVEDSSYWGVRLIKLALKNMLSWCLSVVHFLCPISWCSSPSCSIGVWNWENNWTKSSLGINFLGVAIGKQKAEIETCYLKEMWEILFLRVGFPRCHKMVWEGWEIAQCKEMVILSILQMHL